MSKRLEIKPSDITIRHKFAMFVCVCSVLFPAMALTGFMPEAQDVSTSTLVAIAVIGSAGSGAIAFPRRRLRASISGAMLGGGALLGIVFYVILRLVLIPSESFYNIEFVIAGLLGSLPGLLLLRWWALRPETPLSDRASNATGPSSTD